MVFYEFEAAAVALGPDGGGWWNLDGRLVEEILFDHGRASGSTPLALGWREEPFVNGKAFWKLEKFLWWRDKLGLQLVAMATAGGSSTLPENIYFWKRMKRII